MDKVNHYEDHYFENVYNSFLDDKNAAYYLKLSSFYMYNYFGVNSIDLRDKKVLDYGCGLGHLTACIKADCYDISEFCRDKIREESKMKRLVYDTPEEIKPDHYDIILCNHSLEHYLQPIEQLLNFKSYLKADGILALVLPVDPVSPEPHLTQDIHKHFYSWNFQNTSNLLIELGYEIVHQELVYAPTGLKHFTNLKLIRKLGRLRGLFQSQLTLARKTRS